MTNLAVVGMACRYPDARSPRELWENVLAGRRAFRRLPDERMRARGLLRRRSRATGPLLRPPGRGASRGTSSTASRFRVAGRTFRSTDLTHWLALDVAAQALADAGFPMGEGLPRDAHRRASSATP